MPYVPLFMRGCIARVARERMPHGVPAIGGGLHGMQLVQTPGQLVELADASIGQTSPMLDWAKSDGERVSRV